MTRTLAALAALLLSAGPQAARAQDAVPTTLPPAAGRTIDLGTLSGTAYYTERSDGFHVVATLADTRTGAPMRVETTLAAGQTVTLSTPGGRSGAPHTVEITRLDGAVYVHSVALTN